MLSLFHLLKILEENMHKLFLYLITMLRLFRSREWTYTYIRFFLYPCFDVGALLLYFNII